MKRFLAIIMCVLMVLQVPMVAFAADENASDETSSKSQYESPTDVTEEEEAPLNNEFINFEVQIQMDLPISEAGIELLRKAPQISLQADGTVGTTSTDHVHARFKEVKDNTIIFAQQNVPVGKYTLTMQSEYMFADHTQEVEIENGKKTTLVFSNSYGSYRGVEKNPVGVFAIGDLNDDGVIDETDSELILNNIGMTSTITQYEQVENGTDENGNTLYVDKAVEVANPDFKYLYDINQDGKLDLADLSILSYNMNEEKRDATPAMSVLTTAVTVSNDQEKAVVAEGGRTLDTIMQDADEPIKIAPAKNEKISETNPVEFTMEFAAATDVGAMVIEAPAEGGPAKGTITIETANPLNPDLSAETIEAEIVDEADLVENQPAQRARAMLRSAARSLTRDAEISTAEKATAVRKADGSIEINLGKQVAIKKVTILVTATTATTNLTEIAKVEFLNNMASRIPEPELNIPEGISVSGKGDSFTVTWEAQTNVTGYEVSISAVSDKKVSYPARTYKAGVNRLKVEDFKGGVKDKVTPLWTYTISVKSVNGTWSSPYSSSVSHKQLAAAAPDAPDNVSVNGKYRQLDVSWKDMPGTEKYTVEYREEGTTTYTVVNDIASNSYKITGLKDATTYEVRVKGWNTDDNGNARAGGYSLPAIGKTTIDIPQFPKYGMIERKDINWFNIRGPLDETQYPAGETFNVNYLGDDDYTTYFHSKGWADIGATVRFNKTETIKEFVVTSRLEDGYYDDPGSIYTIYLTAQDEAGNRWPVSCTVQRLHPGAKNTTRYILNEPVTAIRFEFGLHKYYNAACSISEIKYFRYDSLEDDVNALYGDEMHVTLKDGVTLEDIEALETRANTKDETWDEYHPKKDLLLSELAYARDLLANKDNIGGVYNVKADVTKGDMGSINFAGGLSGYQALGYVAQGGSKINVYVGQKGKKVGESVPVRLVFTQYHAESSAWQSGEIALYQGKNEIELPNISSLDFEKGGSLYIVHTNRSAIQSNPVEIRVSGGTKIPTLDLHRTIGNARLAQTGWDEAIRTYVTDLKDYVAKLPASHDNHSESVGTKYTYGNGSNCFLNYTEIGYDNVFLSVPATQILAGLGGVNASIDTLAANMKNTAIAMNQMIELFYKERGFNPATANGAHGIPSARFNIRYQRMFAGAFMYAGGLHTGIEYGSVAGLATGKPVTYDENGKRTGGNMFGWGIAHELGHNADVSGLTYAEVTNNIWAQFEKAYDTAGSTRIPYAAVYNHVTSNTIGKPSSVFAQLGMYWQLHLAYDNNYVWHNYYETGYTAENYNTMRANEFFARYYSINRQGALAPTPNGVRFTGGTTDQNIMRTACAAAERDLTDFFRAWGLDVDATTAAYAGQFPKEERKIQYLNDGAREYTLAGGAPMAEETALKVALEQGTGVNARKVKLTMDLTGCDMNSILGFEILRNGKPVAFVEPTKDKDGAYADTTVYTDVIETENNRVMEYSVVVYDKYLNAKEGNKLDMIKIRHDGELPSDNWTVTTNTTSVAGVLNVYEGTTVKVNGGANGDGVYTDVVTNQAVTYTEKMDVKYLDRETGELVSTYSAASEIFDGDRTSSYEGTIASGLAEVTIDLGGKQQVIGAKFLGTTTKNWSFGVEYSDNGGASFKSVPGLILVDNTPSGGMREIYFGSGPDNKNINAIKATHIRITSSRWNQPLSLGIAELALLAPSGDNVDIGVSTFDSTFESNEAEVWDTTAGIGILENDYVLDKETGEKIPAGSFIVTGQYTGNAAFNVVKLYNEKHEMFNDSVDNKLGGIISGYQAIFAAMPEEGNIVNVKNGTWIFWLEPLGTNEAGEKIYGLPGAGADGADVVVPLPTKVYAELYRVDDAISLAGERLVSDSFVVDVPENLPSINLTSNN